MNSAVEQENSRYERAIRDQIDQSEVPMEGVIQSSIPPPKDYRKLGKSAAVEDSIIPGDILNQPALKLFAQFGHIALVGPTNAGKTTKFLNFLCDQKFEPYEEFIYCGNSKSLTDISGCYAANLYLREGEWKNGRMKYFKLEEIPNAIMYCENPINSHTKLLFIDDAMIQNDNLIKRSISNFVSQAKNHETTVCVTMHEVSGEKERKSVRMAMRYFVLLNADIDTLVRVTRLSKDNIIIRKYMNNDKYDKVLIYDREENIFYDKNYQVFNSV